MIDITSIILPPGYRIVRVASMAQTDEPILAALTRMWDSFRQQDARIPEVIFDLQPGRSSSCATVEWSSSAPVLVLNLKDRSGEKLPGREILHTLLHLAAHGAAGTSRGAEGRYHGAQFADAARLLGLEVSDTPAITGGGWVPGGLATGTLTRYGPEIRALDKALRAWEPVELRKRDRGPLSFACSCNPPRKLRTNAGVAAKGPIICSICGEPFVAYTP